MTDFWRVKQGYLDKLKIILEEGMHFLDYELTPREAKKPDEYNKQQIIWQNRDSSAPKKIRLIFSVLPDKQ